MKKIISSLVIVLCTSQLLFAQQGKLYTPKNLQKSYELKTRSHDGQPGENYWQNFAEYDIAVSLDIKSRKLQGDEKIQY